MSELVKCDVCGAQNWRRTSRWAPEGWLYSFVRDDDTHECTVTIVCSDRCSRNFWKAADATRIQDTPPESPPTGVHLRARLYQLLETWTLQRILAALASCVQDLNRAEVNPCRPRRRRRVDIVIEPAPGDRCGNTKKLPDGTPCPGCRACC